MKHHCATISEAQGWVGMGFTTDTDILYPITRNSGWYPMYSKCWLIKLKDVTNLLEFDISLHNSIFFSFFFS